MAAAKEKDAGAAQVQKNVEEAEQDGFIGRKVDPLPNSAHSLESGPDGVPLVDGITTRTPQVGPEADDAR